MRWIVGTVSFLAPVMLVLLAAAQTPVSSAARDVVQIGVGGVQGHMLKAVTIR